MNKSDNPKSPYGDGRHPPYSLYQNEEGKWGLVDGTGKRLPAIFDRLNEYSFSCVLWEVVTFDEMEGFELQAWYDPDEVWFNFTFGNPDYPDEFAHYLWKRATLAFDEIADLVKTYLPTDSQWLIDCMFLAAKEDDMEDEEFNEALRQYLSDYPDLNEPSKLNLLLDPIMRNPDIGEEIKRTVWNAKVTLDYTVREISELHNEQD